MRGRWNYWANNLVYSVFCALVGVRCVVCCALAVIIFYIRGANEVSEVSEVSEVKIKKNRKLFIRVPIINLKELVRVKPEV